MKLHGALLVPLACAALAALLPADGRAQQAGIPGIPANAASTLPQLMTTSPYAPVTLPPVPTQAPQRTLPMIPAASASPPIAAAHPAARRSRPSLLIFPAGAGVTPSVIDPRK